MRLRVARKVMDSDRNVRSHRPATMLGAYRRLVRQYPLRVTPNSARDAWNAYWSTAHLCWTLEREGVLGNRTE